MKSDLETAIKVIDSKHVEFFSAIESADSKRKKRGIRCSTQWVKTSGISPGFCETKTFAGHLGFF